MSLAERRLRKYAAKGIGAIGGFRKPVHKPGTPANFLVALRGEKGGRFAATQNKRFLLGDRRNGLKIAVLAILLLFKIDQTEPNSPA
jgi:hypothetical protein